MGSQYRVRYFEEHEYPVWNQFVASSPQGTLFSNTDWLDATGLPYRILGCYKGKELVGGIPIVVGRRYSFRVIEIPLLTPYTGVVLRDPGALARARRISSQDRTMAALAEELSRSLARIVLANHYSVRDVRPFLWRGYEAQIKYTYVVDLSSPQQLWERLEANTRKNVRVARKRGVSVTIGDDIEAFDWLHRLTFERQNRPCPIPTAYLMNLYEMLVSHQCCRIYFARDSQGELSAAIFVAWDEKRAYYLMGATHPDRRSDAAGTLVMFAAMEDLSQNLPEMDLVGANIPIIARFKRGFGGMLKSYFVLSSTPSLSLLSYQLLRELVSRVRERFRRRQPQD